MNNASEFIRDFSRPLVRSIIVTSIAAVAGVLILFLLILPLRSRSKGLSKEIETLNLTLSGMKSDIARAAEQELKTAQLKKERDAIFADGSLEPLLGSLAMRAKSILGLIAQQTGFTIDSVKELPSILLRLPTPAAEQLYARQPIEFMGHGSFDEIIAFITETEQKHALVTLSGLVILSQPALPESHKAIITFEWLVKGDRPKATSTVKEKQ